MLHMSSGYKKHYLIDQQKSSPKKHTFSLLTLSPLNGDSGQGGSCSLLFAVLDLFPGIIFWHYIQPDPHIISVL